MRGVEINRGPFQSTQNLRSISIGSACIVETTPDGKRQLTFFYKAGSPEDQTHVSFHEPESPRNAASPPAQVNTCPPRCLLNRNHRPSDLVVTRSNGLTTIPVSELKQRICDGRTQQHYDTKAQVPRPKLHRRLPKTPIREIQQAMGNTHSTTTSSPPPDNSSIRSHSKRNPVRVLRKSSINLLNRIESKSPLPPAVTGTVIQVHQQVSPLPPLPAVSGGRKYENDESPVDPFMDGSHRSSSSPDADAASPVTVTEETAMQPLSASTTIRESRAENRRESRMGSSEEGPSQLQPPPPPSRPTSQACCSHQPLRVSPVPPSAASKRDTALSPTIPAPSPLPEDSPHKYGLKDRMETPELVEPEEINVAKARRRSSGIEIFNVRSLIKLRRFAPQRDNPY